jgi:hypothetical protein
MKLISLMCEHDSVALLMRNGEESAHTEFTPQKYPNAKRIAWSQGNECGMNRKFRCGSASGGYRDQNRLKQN